MPYIDLAKSDENAATPLVQTVRKNYKWCTKKEFIQAKEAIHGQGIIGSLSKSNYKAMVSSNMIRNCPISQHDVSNTCTMFGLQLVGVRGKTTWSKPEPVVEEYAEIPRDFFL